MSVGTGDEFLMSGQRLHSCFLAFLLPLVSVCSASAEDDVKFDRVIKAQRSRVVAGGTTVIRTIVSNRGEQAFAGSIIAKLAGPTITETARVVSISPGDTKQFEIPIELPASLQPKKLIEIEVTLRSPDERIATFDGQPVRDVLELRVAEPQSWVASAFAPAPPDYPAWFWPAPPKEHPSYEFAVAVQVDEENTRDFIGYEKYGLPSRLSEWSNIDLIVVSAPDLLYDSTALEALRQYIRDGGRAWVMLDVVPSELIRTLFEDHQSCIEIGTVQLNEFVADPVANNSLSEKDRSVTSDTPITFKRVVTTGGNTLQSIEGWPAAVEFSVGYGNLYLTTLGDYGWLEARKTQKPDPMRQAKYTMRRWAKPVSGSLAGISRAKRPLDQELEYPLELLGAPVIPRSGVGIFLASFCVLLTGIGAWFWTRGDLAWVGAAMPLTALVAGAGMIIAKSWVNSDVPETLARLQLVDVSSDGLRAHVREQAAVLLDSVDSLRLKSASDGRANPMSSADSGLFRYSVSGFEQWEFENKNWPTGTSRYSAEYGLDLDEPLHAVARLSESGCELELPNRLKAKFEDAVLTFQPGNPMLCASADSGLTATGDVKAGGGRWIEGTFMSDEQRRRSSIFEEYFGDADSTSRPSGMLCGWAELWPNADLDREIVRKGSALLSIPTKLQRPDPGKKIAVPYGFLRLVQSELKQGSTTAFDEVSGRWRADQTQAIDRPFEFVMPRELLPFAATEVLLELDIKAPQRMVTVKAVKASGETVVLAELNGPSLPWSTRITDEELLESLADGTLQVWLQVSDRKNPSSSNVVAWNVGYFHASAKGSIKGSVR